MSVRSVETLRHYVSRLCEEARPPDDAVLLKQFVAANDRVAFELLIARHGPMVLGTARRLVDDSNDADDVFQAVFLSLARLAKTIRHGCTLPAWLHKATCQIAAKVRKTRNRRSKEPSPTRSEQPDPSAGLVWQEVRQALDEELQRLPERLRSPLLLCYLSGLTRDEAAKQLGWSLSTVKRRLEEARKTLQIRLEKRGIAAVGLALTVLTPEALQATVSKSLLDSTVKLIFSTAALTPAMVSVIILGSMTAMKGPAMKTILALVAVVGIGVGIYAGMGQADPPGKFEGKKEDVKSIEEVKVVQRDEPLPAGSTFRFGTPRYRYGTSIKTMAVSPDGKRAIVVNDNDVPRVYDLATGRVLLTLNWGSVEVAGFSPDGRTLVLKQGFDLYVFDAATGKQLRKITGAGGISRSASGVLAFTPDGKAVATISDGKDVHLFDFESGNTIRDFVHEIPKSGSPGGFQQVLAVAFSPDGKLMASGGYANEKGNYFARLWEVETGKELRRCMHGKLGYGIASLAFSPDGKMLGTLGTQAGVFLRLFDVETGKELRAFPKDGNQRTEHDSVVFSPDGKTVAAALGSIHLYDTTTGKERLRIDRRASDLHFTDDGKTLTAAVSGAIYRWDTATGKTLTPDAADSTVEQILVTPDGTRVVTRGQDSEVHIWDGVNGKHLRRFQAGWQSSLAMSRDGRFLAWPVSDESVQFTDLQEPTSTLYGSRIRLYDIAADKFVDRFPAFKAGTQDLAFSTDGKKLVTADQRMVQIWDFETAKEERTFPVTTEALKKKNFRGQRTQLSPDGKTAVVTYVEHSNITRLGMRGPPHEVRLWDVATGKELSQLNGGYPIDNAFSPDGRLVVTRGGNHVCEVATGKRVGQLPDDPKSYIRAAAFSRDGRCLATAVSDGVIQIWEVATWTKRNEFKGSGGGLQIQQSDGSAPVQTSAIYDDQSITLTFGPGGQLYSGNRDTTVLVWNIRPSRAAASVSLESAWNGLAVTEASVSFKSEGRFLTAPSATVKFFADKIKMEKPIDAKRVQQLLVDLDSDQFANRDVASKAFSALGQQVKPYLEVAIKTTKSKEVQDRAEKILEGLQAAAATPHHLRQLRSVMVLESIGNDESKNLLMKWAGGPAGALLTDEATAALARLNVVASPCLTVRLAVLTQVLNLQGENPAVSEKP